jgi:dihydrofolate reductase
MIQKILVVVDSIDENSGSGAKANIALITNLKKARYQLRVYHYSHREMNLENIECILIPEQKWSILFLLGRFQRLLARWTGINLNKWIERTIGFSFTYLNDSRSIRTVLQKDTSFQPDLILTLSQAASFRPHHALLQLAEWHSKWMAYVHDPYPFHCYPKPYDWFQDGFKQKEKFFRKVSEKAAHSAFPSLLLKEWMGQFFPAFQQSGKVIPHQVYRTPLFEELPSFFEQRSFTLLHAGNLLSPRNPTGLLKGFEIFLNNHPEAFNDTQLMLIGGHDYYKQFLQTFASNPLIVIASQLDYNTSMLLQQQTSVNIILEAKSTISPFLPGKFPHCVQADRPILLLAPAQSETRRLLGNDYPFWAEIDDSKKIAELISRLYQQWKNAPENFRLNRPDLISYCDVDELKRTLDTI